MLLIRSASLYVYPVVGSGAISPTVKTPNCMALSFESSARCMTVHALQQLDCASIPATKARLDRERACQPSCGDGSPTGPGGLCPRGRAGRRSLSRPPQGDDP